MDGLLVSEKCLNQPVFCSLPFPPAATYITRESILSCPALSTMFPGRLARLATGADSTKQQRLACAGCTADSVWTGVVLVEGKAKREVAESLGDRVSDRLTLAFGGG